MSNNLILKVKKIEFNKDINFLRSLSVLGVVFYHINKNFLQGGWLGVDIFFFISGYLLSNKIIVGLNNNSFNFIEFYKRRVNRILPALTSTLFLSFIVAFYILPPNDLYIFLKSTQTTLLFYSNFFFQSLDSYNSPSNKFLPLLHMWSLSIEEQFYIIFPIVLFIIYKFKRKNAFTFVLIISFVSLVLNFLEYPIDKFYYLQFRVWEFLLGMIFMVIENKINFKRDTKILGLLIICYSFYNFQDSSINFIYPKIICLLGVFFFLLNSVENKAVDKITTSKLLQHIGLISFSLYLMHQPLFAFFRKYNHQESEISLLIVFPLLLILFLISHLNWKFVELPFQKNLNNKKLIVLLIFYLIFLISIFGLLSKDNFLQRYSSLPSKLVLLSFKNLDVISKNGVSCDNRPISETCNFNYTEANYTIYIIGDSSLRTLSTALLEYQEIEKFNLVHITGNDCLFLLEGYLNSNSCPKKNFNEFKNFVENINNSIIIYGGRLPRYLSGKGFDNSIVAEDNDINVTENFEIDLKNTLNYLATNNKLIIIYPIPEQGWNVPELYFYGEFEWGETIGYPSNIWYERVKSSNILLDSIINPNIFRVYPENIFCDNLVVNQCLGAYKNLIFYSDDDHLSLEGSKLIANEIIKLLKIIN